MSLQRIALLIATCLLLQACVTKIVTTPIKAVYTVGKYTVKGTAAVVGAVIPDNDDDKPNQDQHQTSHQSNHSQAE